jgi:hypothetical protein
MDFITKDLSLKVKMWHTLKDDFGHSNDLKYPNQTIQANMAVSLQVFQ